VRQGAGYFGVMFAGVIGCSLLFYLLIDQPVERLRRIVRRRP
jgi:peptidoglycan/LPS O-acetylase OafA/YrhL